LSFPVSAPPQPKRHPISVTFITEYLLNLNHRGECHDKGLPENADVKASEGVLCPFEVLLISFAFCQFFLQLTFIN
jgi:hypothetical protein